MKISVNYWMLEGGAEAKLPVLEAIKRAKELGFDAIELCIFSEGVLTDNTTESECKQIAAYAEKTGIEISSLASCENWEKPPTVNDPEARKKAIEFTKKALQITAWLGTDVYLYVPGTVSEAVPYDICYERAAEAIRQLIPVAEQTGVAIGVENVWNKFLLSPLEMRDFIDSFNSKMVVCYFDVGNVLLTGYPEHWIKILGDQIKRIHIKDFKVSVGTFEGFVDLLEGDVDFEKVKKALADISYDGYVTSELMPYVAGRPEKTLTAMNKIFKS